MNLSLTMCSSTQAAKHSISMATIWAIFEKRKIKININFAYCETYARPVMFGMHASEKMSFIKSSSPICRKSVPSGQRFERFLSDMALSIYEVVRVACQSGVVGLFTPREKLRDWQIMQTTSLMLIAMLARKKPLLIRSKRLSSENLTC